MSAPSSSSASTSAPAQEAKPKGRRCIVIPADRDPYEHIMPDREYQLAALNSLVGGYFELIQASDDLEYYVNEDAIRLGLPVNKHLTKLKGTIVLVKHSSAGVITKLPQGITLDNWKSNVFPYWK